MFTPNWPSNHALRTVVLLIELPQAEQLVDYGLLLCSAAYSRYISRILAQAYYVEICAETKGNKKA